MKYLNARQLSVALVYPPYGPVGLPSLGLAILSSQLKKLGYRCKTFFWNIDFLDSLPVEGADAISLYRVLTGRSLHPWNEWPFALQVFPELASRRHEATDHLKTLERSSSFRTWAIKPSEVIGHLEHSVPGSIEKMVQPLLKYDVVGINSTFYQQSAALALAQALKSRKPSLFIALGGANCDGGMGRAYCEQFPWIDATIEGEADLVFPELVQRIEVGEVESGSPMRCVNIRTPRGLIPAEEGAILNDLDQLSDPDFDDYVDRFSEHPLTREYPICLPLESSRGCWWGEKHHCTFCGLNANGMTHRTKSFHRFSAEVLRVHNRYRNRFFFMTDNILARDYYSQLVEWTGEHKLTLDFFYEIKSNVRRIDVERLASGGVTFVQPGIESFSSNVLRLMNKGVTGIQNVSFLKYARDYGISVVYNILYGFPGENGEDYLEMLQQFPALQHLAPPTSCVEIEFHRFSPYHSHPERFNIELRPLRTYRYLYPVDEGTLNRIAYVFERCDKGSSDRTFVPRLVNAVLRWRNSFDEQICSLQYEEAAEGRSIVRDSRSGFGRCRIILEDFASKLLFMLDAPRSVRSVADEIARSRINALPVLAGCNALASSETFGNQSLGPPRPTEITPAQLFQLLERKASTFEGSRERTIRFSEQDFLNDPTAQVNLLKERGLVYVEGDRAVSLVVRSDHKELRQDWRGCHF